VIAADKELGMVKNARADGVPKTVIFSVANVSHLPFFSHLFDAVVALGLFAYVANPGQVFAELSRVTRHGGKVMVTNAVVHPKEPLVAAAGENGLRLIEEAEGYCPAASGVVKRRYLCVFETA
jgi:ubiquinone/menaquinone biosynthesis C-methylase UbiE